MPAHTRDEVLFIASITSTNIRKIVFSARHGFESEGDQVFKRYYQTIDDCLCQLVGRLRESGYEHRLEMVYRIWDVPLGEGPGFKGFLPRFREQGRVKLLWMLSDTVVYCSDGECYSCAYLNEALTVISKDGVRVLDFASLPGRS